MTSTQPARGTRDFLPDDVRRREFVIDVVRGVYERYGFEALETPAIENIETLLGKYGEEGNKLIFKILRRGEHEASGEADLALRYDLTVPLARVVAQYHGDLPRFFKRYQIQPVWRADRPARGRFREFYQCDVDAIGSESPVVEAEVLSAASDVMTELGFADFVVRVNHRRILTAQLDVIGIPDRRHADALVIIDKLDKLSPERVIAELEAKGIEHQKAVRCLELFHVDVTDRTIRRSAGLGPELNAANIERLRETLASHQEGLRAVEELADIVSLVARTTAGHTVVDPSLARGLSYYTGAIMEIAVPDLGGSLGGGGRYDDLIGMFLGRSVPACGFSLGLERIIVVMTERNMFPATVARSAVDVMVTLWNDATRGDALEFALELRRAGLRVDVYPEPERLGKQFRYAASRHAPMVAILGDDERSLGQVALKDLRTGEQRPVPRAEAAEFVKRRLYPEP